MSLAKSITRAKGGVWTGKQGLVPGPGHNSKDRSMAIMDNEAGDDVICHSFANDDPLAFKAALRAEGLLPTRSQPGGSSAAPLPSYVYRDRNGAALYRIARKPGKKFVAETPDGRGGWRAGMGEAKPIPYRLPELLAADDCLPVYIVEGEKDADTLASLGFVATTNPFGAGKWPSVFSPYFADREVFIIPDNDKPGRDHADDVARKLAGSARAVAIVTLPGVAEKGDVSDWLAAGGTAEKLFQLEREAVPRVEASPANDTAGDWDDPEPLAQGAKADPYPIDALPPIMAEAVREVQAYVQAPMAMVAGAALGALSIAAQGLVDIDRDSSLTGPCSLFLLTIAESGERKSSCDGYFSRAIEQWERDRAAELAPAVAEAEGKLAAWSAERAGVLEAIKRNGKDNKPTAELKARLVAMDASKPKLVQVPVLRLGDTTPESTGSKLATEWPSGGIMSSEAGVVFGSHGMGKDSQQRNLALLNILWDGGSLRVSRRTSEGYSIDGARLSMALQTQEASLRAFVDGGKGLARGMGFFARFLIAWPESTQGSRTYCEAKAMPAVARFNEWVRGLLDRALPLDSTGRLVPTRIALDPEAKAVWVAYHDSVEARLRPGGDLSDVRDVASKTADNAARMAALFHCLRYGTEGEVSADDMRRGCALAGWYLGQAQRLFAGLLLDPGIQAAAMLDSWLVARCDSESVQSLPTATVAQFGPNSLRAKEAWGTALSVLAKHGRARLVTRDRRAMLEVNPKLLR
jgi:putative DNA primase/helicase